MAEEAPRPKAEKEEKEKPADLRVDDPQAAMQRTLNLTRAVLNVPRDAIPPKGKKRRRH